MKNLTIHDLHFAVLFEREEIVERVRGVARRINTAYEGCEPMFVVLLNGAMFFAVDLLREVSLPCMVETLRTSSYGHSTVSSGTVQFLTPLPDVRGKDVIIIEDIVDTGLTLRAVIDALKEREPRSLSVAAFINKPESHEQQVQVDYACYTQNVGFVVGYGLDYAGRGREFVDVYERTASPGEPSADRDSSSLCSE